MSSVKALRREEGCHVPGKKKATSEGYKGFPVGSIGKESACNVRDPSLILRLRRSLEEGNGYPLQYSCLENSMDRGAWWSTVHGVAKSQT